MALQSAGQRLGRLPAAERKIAAHNAAICRDWLQWLRDHGRQPVTVHQYGARCEELIEFLGRTKLEDVTLDMLEAWIARPRLGRGKGRLGADSTRAKEVLIVRGLWGWAVAHGRLLADPTRNLENPRVRDEDPKAIPAEVWHSFWISPTLTDVERVVFGLGFYCGLRRQEIAQLEVSHVDIDQGVIGGFRRKGDRGKHSGRLPVVNLARFFAQEHPILLPDRGAFLGPLKALCVDRRDIGARWLIPWGEQASASLRGRTVRPVPDGMTSPDQINGRLQRALVRSGLPARVFSPHALRHSFVTYLLRAGVPLHGVSKLANHSEINVTLRYAKVEDDPLAGLLTADSFDLRGPRW